jgi:Asp-tRNA(Asn)/Glu-tRNA(Gln) amidotransferase A subunit family amidase
MTDLELSYTPASVLAERIRQKQLSPVEVMENCLARIDEVQPKLNCFAFVFPDEAMAKAKAAEQAVMKGDVLGPLHGVPLAIKDLTPTKGKRTTLGSYAFEHNVPTRDAVIVTRLTGAVEQGGAGGIMVGKTTTPEFAYSSYTESPLWGITRNPWNTDRCPGGSSGGSGAAVASGCVPIAEGTDMGGSVRIPAAWSGTVGLKPAIGRIPMDILPSVFDSLSHFGPLARTIDDARLFLDAAQGPDDIDIQSNGTRVSLPDPTPGDIAGMRFAMDVDLSCYYIDPGVEREVRAAAQALKDAGATVEEVELDWPPRFNGMWVKLWGVFMSGYFGDKLEEFRDRMDPNVVALIELGNSLSATEYKRLEIERTDQWNRFRPILARYDAFLCPTMAIPAPPVGGSESDFRGDGDDGLYHGQDMTALFNNIPHCPALSVPAGWTDDNLPVGLQIVTHRYREDTALRIGRALELQRPWAQMRPPI